MIRKYKFYDREAVTPGYITYDFPIPFEKKLDDELKSIYGSDLTFVKEINHLDRIIRLHSAYDSGKGTKYVAPVLKLRRERIDIKLSRILSNIETRILELRMCNEKNIVIVFFGQKARVFRNASVHKGNVGGFTQGVYQTDSLFKYLMKQKYYPDNYVFHPNN